MAVLTLTTFRFRSTTQIPSWIALKIFSRNCSLSTFEESFPNVDYSALNEIMYLEHNPQSLTKTYHDVKKMTDLLHRGRRFVEHSIQVANKIYFS